MIFLAGDGKFRTNLLIELRLFENPPERLLPVGIRLECAAILISDTESDRIIVAIMREPPAKSIFAGFLMDEDARRYREQIKKLNVSGTVVCKAAIIGNSHNFRTELDIAWPLREHDDWIETMRFLLNAANNLLP